MGMAMLWSKLDTIRRDTVARTTPWIRRDAGDCKLMVGAATSMRRATVGSGDTIIALSPHRRPAKTFGFRDGDREAAPELTRKLFKIRFADSDGRRQSASFLVQRRYAWRGYQTDRPAGMEPSRITLSAYDGDDVVATISVGLDSSNDLFVNALFADEVESLRAGGRKVCEFTKLAIEGAIKSQAVIAALFHTAYIHARRIYSCTDLVVEVNPRHVLFYKRMLGFTTLGPTRVDPRVEAPATLLHLDLRHAEGEIGRLGGKPELAAQGRSLYPYFFSPKDEAGIERRLRMFG